MGDGDLFVGNAVQKTYIEVDEKGTEAAAVTCMTLSRGRSMTEQMIVDRPFFFFLLGPSDTILFAGQVEQI